MFVYLCSLLNDWNYFWNKYCNLPFVAICCFLLCLLIFFLRHPDIKKQKLGCEWACERKKWLIIILKDFKKQPTFLSFSFLIDCRISVFSLSLGHSLLIPCSSSEMRMLLFNANFSACKLIIDLKYYKKE